MSRKRKSTRDQNRVGYCPFLALGRDAAVVLRQGGGGGGGVVYGRRVYAHDRVPTCAWEGLSR